MGNFYINRQAHYMSWKLENGTVKAKIFHYFLQDLILVLLKTYWNGNASEEILKVLSSLLIWISDL